MAREDTGPHHTSSGAFPSSVETMRRATPRSRPTACRRLETDRPAVGLAAPGVGTAAQQCERLPDAQQPVRAAESASWAVTAGERSPHRSPWSVRLARGGAPEPVARRRGCCRRAATPPNTIDSERRVSRTMPTRRAVAWGQVAGYASGRFNVQPTRPESLHRTPFRPSMTRHVYAVPRRSRPRGTTQKKHYLSAAQTTPPKGFQP